MLTALNGQLGLHLRTTQPTGLHSSAEDRGHQDPVEHIQQGCGLHTDGRIQTGPDLETGSVY